MKKFFLILGIFAIMLSTLVSCQEDAPSPDNPNTQNAASKSAAVKNVLKMAASSQALERLGFNSPSIFSEQMGMSAGRTNDARKLSGARSSGDTTEVWDSEAEWTTCATETFVENEDGSYTWTLDYGEEGCEDYGYFMKGKMVETFKEEDNQFSGTIEYFNFGDKYSTENGKTTYFGTWEESGNAEDSTDWTYSGTYEYSENLVYNYKDDEVDETYTVVASGKEVYDENGYTVTEEDYSYTEANGNYFSGSLSSPLLYLFSCENGDENNWVFTYVSGGESYDYKEGDESGTFSIDYGDGSCDNIITITENGETYEIDLGDEWEDEWEEDLDEESTSGS